MRKKKSPLKSSKLIQRKRKLLLLRIGGIVLLSIIFILSIVFLTRLNIFAITSITVEGNSAVDTDTIKQVAQQDIQGNYIGIFLRSNKFVYPRSSIIKDILSQSARLQKVSLHVAGHTLVVSVVEYTPRYTWCAGSPLLDSSLPSDSKCYFMNENGLLFSEAPTFSGTVFFAFYGMITQDNPIGSLYLNNTQFKNIDTFIDLLNSHNLHPYALEAESSGVYNLYIEHGGKIIFKQDQDIPTLISNMQLILKDTPLFSKKATSTVEYIDLRFGNKLFYKQAGDNASTSKIN